MVEFVIRLVGLVFLTPSQSCYPPEPFRYAGLCILYLPQSLGWKIAGDGAWSFGESCAQSSSLTAIRAACSFKSVDESEV